MTVDAGKDIRDRAFRFACEAVRLGMDMAPKPGLRSIVDQLVRAATAVGANLEEAKAASTRREFTRGLEISLREAREALYWLRICSAVRLTADARLRPLESEADQLVRILTSIVVSTKRRKLAAFVMSAFCILNSALLLSS